MPTETELPGWHQGAAPANGRAMAARDHGRPARQSHSWPAVSVLDADVTMRFWTARLLGFELLLPPTRFSTRLVSSSQLVAFVHFVRGPGIFISNHLGGFTAKEGLFMFAAGKPISSGVAFGAHDEPNYSAGLVPFGGIKRRRRGRRINITCAGLNGTGCASEEI
jgi:hypothetical protein